MSALAQFDSRAPAAFAAERWSRGVAALARDLDGGRLDAARWQAAMAAFCRTIAPADLLAGFDLARLERRWRSFGPGEHRIAIGLPGSGPGALLAAELTLLTPGRAIPPHGHNCLAAAHLVLRGTGRVRIYDRVADTPNSVRLWPRDDAWLEPGAGFTAADPAGNVHWLSAGSAALVLLDLTVAIAGPAGFRQPCTRDGRVYLDPTGPAGPDNLIDAPLLDPLTAAARFGIEGAR